MREKRSETDGVCGRKDVEKGGYGEFDGKQC